MPNEFEAFLFELLSLLGTAIINLPYVGYALRKLGHVIGFLLKALSPAVPLNIRESASFSKDPSEFFWNISKYTFPLTIFYCYFLNAVLTYRVGTFWPGSESGRMYFLTDGYNALLYWIVCPLYVSIAACLVATAGLSWQRMNLYTTEAVSDRNHLSPATRFAGFIGVSFLIVAIYISDYINDLTNPLVTERTYWFFDLTNGVRSLNAAGAYYLVMNAVLLFITALAAFSYISISIEIVRLGRHLDTSAFAVKNAPDEKNLGLAIGLQENHIREALTDFSYCYILAKILVFVYAVNICIWQISPAGSVKNVHSAIVAVILIGLLFLVIPRLYLGSKWHRLKLTYLQLRQPEVSAEELEEVEYKDVRSSIVQKTAIILDTLFVILLALVLYWQYRKSGLIDVVAAWWRDWWLYRR
jgi:hypothetical protein